MLGPTTSDGHDESEALDGAVIIVGCRGPRVAESAALARLKTPLKLPTVLSPNEVTRLIEASSNLMHPTILMILYGTGKRRTEASLLKVSDIDSQRMAIHIRQGKGSRDRDVPLTNKLLEALREYWRAKRPKLYLENR